MNRLHFFIAVAATIAGIAAVSARDWPTRPVTIVAPAAAGSSTDIVARILTPRLSELLGQQVIVENVGGAGGMTGSARVARAAPDGYQFVLGFAGTHAISQTLFKHPLYNSATDFAPVGLVANVPIILVARKDLPAGNLQEFIAYAKANQAKMQYGSPGAGSTVHLACALLNAAIGVNITHIPYRGGGPAMQDLIAGRLDYQCVATTIAVSQIESKTVKAIAILARERSPVLPIVATAHEQGLRDFEAGTWFASFLPKGTPAAIVRKLNDATVAAMNTPAVEDRLKEIGAELAAPERRSPEYLANFVVSEIEKWAAAIKATGISAD
jgi:tripartite-type tricarboxylate transporter receptor subunit TctC